MSAEAINQLYIETYGRPASQEEISYHANRFGSELDEIESQSLQREMTSVPGYTPPEKTAEAGVGGTPPSQPPEAPAEAPQLGIYMREALPSTSPRISGLDYYRNTFLNPYDFRGAIARQNIASRPRYSDYNFNPYSQNYMNQYQGNRMNSYKSRFSDRFRVHASPTEEDRKKYFSKDKPQLFSSGEQFSKNTQPFSPYSPRPIGVMRDDFSQQMQQPSPMGGGKGGRPSGTMGMRPAPARMGGKM